MKPLDLSFGERGWSVPEFALSEWGERRSPFALCVFVLNEGERFRAQLERMQSLTSQIDIIVADGGSSDGSTDADFLAHRGVRALLTKRGPGRLSAQMRMALAYALERGYEGVIVMDGNNKDDPAAVPAFMQLLADGYDHVQGSRYVPGGKAINTPLARHWAVKYLHAPLVSRAAGFRYSDTTNGFRAYSRRLLLDARVAPFRDVFSGYELHYYLAIRAARLGFRVCETPVTRAYPLGKTPTKIRGLRGNLLILRTLWRACRHRYDPQNPASGGRKPPDSLRLKESGGLRPPLAIEKGALMRAALIGHTGFVGGNLLREHPFTGRYNSANIDSIAGEHFDFIVCAGAPAAKWKANADPASDRACLGRLMAALERVTTQRFVHISTVDVYGQPAGVDEDCPPSGATAYGRHRLELEQFVHERFQAMVVRLPALFGPGLKKNAIYDLMNNNQIEKIDTRAVFQFYNIRRLWRDIRIVSGVRLSLIHLATEPVAMGEVASRVFGKEWVNHLPGIPQRYDVRTKHAALFGGSGGYISNKASVLAELSEFVWAQQGGRQCA